ncbi:MAG: protein-tyrosine kinase [Lachnospiraceae bacterium]|nr:protein-tyrosine kinase [Lachnospiraceae bacterium]
MDNNNNNKTNDMIEIDLLEVFSILIGRWWLILLVALTTAIAGFAISFFVIKPTYESTTKIYILNKSDSQTVTYSDVQLGTQLTKDYSELINSRYVVEEVIQKMGLDLEYAQMKKKISVSSPSDTRILAITVSDHDPVVAMNMANALRESASQHISNVMDIDAVNIVESANMPTEKSSPSYTKWIVVGGALGGILMCAIILIGYLMDDTIKTSEDVERFLGLSTLGIIPIIETEDNRKKKKRR